MVKGTFSIAADHPALAGHFPNNPVVPGVVLLDEAAGFITEELGKVVIGLQQARFKRPLPLGTSCDLDMETTDDGKAKVRGHINGDTIFSAVFVIGPTK